MALTMPALAARRRTGRGAGGLTCDFAVEFVARVDVDRAAEQALDVAQEIALLRAAEGDGLA